MDGWEGSVEGGLVLREKADRYQGLVSVDVNEKHPNERRQRLLIQSSL